MTAATPTRPYRGISAEQRRADRRARLIEVTLDLLATEGLQATTVRAISERAGLTRRYFYESFADLDALLSAAFDQILTQTTTAVLTATAQAPHEAHAKARAAITAFITLITDDPRKIRAAFVETLGNKALRSRYQQAQDAFMHLIGEQIRAFYGFPPAADPLVDFAVFMLVTGSTETLFAWLDGRLKATPQEMIENYTDFYTTAGQATAARVRSQFPDWTPL